MPVLFQETEKICVIKFKMKTKIQIKLPKQTQYELS